MIKDETKALVKMTGVCESLRELGETESIQPIVTESFTVDKQKSHLIEVLSGSCMCATGWREKVDLKEVTGLVNLGAGEACLYLPGEPRLIRPAEGSEVSEFILE